MVPFVVHVFFAPAIVGGNEPGQFVSKGFCRWVKISDKARQHGKSEYHMAAMAKNGRIH